MLTDYYFLAIFLSTFAEIYHTPTQTQNILPLLKDVFFVVVLIFEDCIFSKINLSTCFLKISTMLILLSFCSYTFFYSV